ncbi:acetoacetate decarboxylase family protein [Deinococcus oregonensis]|uniref:Acetoacetate decarboxylase family protein n=1 Tax=Deinococcus oregonensis TaxID=1805970 RepID=A0ABV6AVV0_9DEIO
MIKGYSQPLSPLGLANLVKAPPWHYAGTVLAIDFWADPTQAQAVMPPGMRADPEGRATGFFIEWQATASSDQAYLDPVGSQYREFFVLLAASLDGEAVATCPYIFVDQDVSLVRGLIQGYPKVMGSIHLTRAFTVPSLAAPVVGPGGRFAGTLAAKDRRLAEGQVTLRETSEEGPRHTAFPIVNLRYFPRLEAGQHHNPAVYELLRQRWENRTLSTIWQGDADLQFFGSPHHELAALTPVKVGHGYRYDMAITIQDAEVVRKFN